MGGSGKDPNKGTNGSAGGVDCVQQRNESQWPGKILGPDVIPEGSEPAPRSGKLLGTDDANVDWYKLEQSKRSEAFHFGKHDHDIKNVQAFASNSAESQDSDGNWSSSEGNFDSVEECEKLRGLEDLGMNVEPSLLLKRKSSQFSLNQELLLLLKNKNRQHALMNVSKHTKMVSVHVGEQLPSPDILELEGSRKNEWASNGDISIITESESFGNLYDVPLVAEEKCSAADFTGLPSIISDAPQQSSQSSHVHASSLLSEENESSPAGSNGILAWRSKGKRSSRSRKSYLLFEEEVAGTHAAAVWGRDVGSMDTAPRPIIQIRSVPFRQSRLTVNPKYDQSGFSIHPDHADRCLYDVTIEVKSSCRTDRLPYISLVSKLTGCPIVGYPLTIEVLDDDDISGYHYNSSKDGNASRVRKHMAVNRPRSKHQARGLLGRSLKSRRSNGPMSKKTRRLTSFTGAHNLSRGVKKPLPVEMANGATVACVPLNVVFSRMNADLSSLVRPGRHPI